MLHLERLFVRRKLSPHDKNSYIMISTCVFKKNVEDSYYLLIELFVLV